MKRCKPLISLLAVLILFAVQLPAQTPSIGTPTLTPDLTITHFAPYTVASEVTPNNTTITGVSFILRPQVASESNPNWDFLANGQPSPNPNVDIVRTATNISGNIWQDDALRPDAIYPQIGFFIGYDVAPDGNSRFYRDSYELLHFTNPYPMGANTSFFIEIYAKKMASPPLSVDMQVYLVGKGYSITAFQTGGVFANQAWQTAGDVELVGTIAQTLPFNHTHGDNSSHYLVALSTDANGKLGTKAIDISGDYWIILTTGHSLQTRGWDLQYRTGSKIDGTWYKGSGTTFTEQNGRPDVHVHYARNPQTGQTVWDGMEVKVKVDYTYNSTPGTLTSLPTYFYFGTIPNLAPNASSFTAPPAGTYNGNVTISWNPATDPNNDVLAYKVDIINPTTQAVVHTAATGVSGTSISFNTTLVSDGTYDIKVTATDDDVSPLSTSFLWSSSFGSGFIISNGNPPIIWDGSESTDWNTAANWTPETVPEPNDDVNIPDVTNDPLIPSGSSHSVNNLTIQPGATLNLEPTAKLTVTGALTNNTGESGLVLQSTSAGTASLRHNSTFVSGTIERYITGEEIPGTAAATLYHTVSVPLTSNSDPLSGLFLDSYLYRFDATAATQKWEPMGTATNTLLDVKQGYLIYYPQSSKTYAFDGLMNAGTFTATVSYSTSPTNYNYNLVPNPYPSAIDWDANPGWTKTNVDNAIWIWNPTANNPPYPGYTVGNYASYISGTGTNNGSNIIPVGQAFFVRANAASPQLLMNNDVRVHDDKAFFKDKEQQTDILRIKALANNFSDEIVVRFRDGATHNFDNSFDAGKMYGMGGSPQLFSVSEDDHKLSINSIMASGEVISVPVGFELDIDKEVIFDFSSAETFAPEVAIVLWDKLTDQKIDLRTRQQYAFAHQKENDPMRFVLLFNSPLSVDELSNNQNLDLFAYYNGQSLVTDVPQELGNNAVLTVYNTAGQVVFEEKVVQSVNYSKLPGVVAGIFMVKVTGDNGTASGKVSIR